MDGLKIQTGFENFSTPTIQKERNTRVELNPNGAPGVQVPGVIDANKSFVDTLKDAVQAVNTAQKEADVKMQDLATGKSQNIHETMIAAEKADIALRLMVQVRNKMIEAYQEIMRMQV